MFILSLFRDCFKRKPETEYTVKNLREIFQDTQEEERMQRQFARTYAWRRNRQIPNIDREIRRYEPLR